MSRLSRTLNARYFARRCAGLCAARFVAGALLACCGLAATAHAQSFQRAIGTQNSDTLYAVELAQFSPDGGYIAVGSTPQGTTGVRDILVSRHRADGTQIWGRVIGNQQADEAGYSVAPTFDGGFVVGFESSASGTFGAGMLKLNAGGGLVWSNRYVGTPFVDFPAGVSVKQDARSGELVMVNRFRPNANAPLRGVYTRTDANGNTFFSITYAAPGAAGQIEDTRFNDVAIDRETSELVIAGTVRRQPQAGGNVQQDALFVRLLPGGGPLAWRYHGVPSLDETGDGIDLPTSVFAPATEAVFSGRNNLTLGAPFSRTHVVRTTPAGAPLVAARFRGFLNGYAAVRYSPAQAVVVGGTTETGLVPPPPSDAVMLLLSAGLNQIWGWTYGTPNTVEEGHAAIQTFTSPAALPGYALAGLTTIPTLGGNDGYFIQADANGKTGCNEQQITFPRTEQWTSTVGEPLLQQLGDWITYPVELRDAREKLICGQDPEPCGPCYGDVNGDGVVDDTDFVAFAACYEAFIVAPGTVCVCLDVNNDGLIDDTDFVAFAAAYEAFICP